MSVTWFMLSLTSFSVFYISSLYVIHNIISSSDNYLLSDIETRRPQVKEGYGNEGFGVCSSGAFPAFTGYSAPSLAAV